MNHAQSLLSVAAKAVIVNNEGEVLIVREAATGVDNTKIGRWGLVGGRLEPGETFEAGLAREAMEEVGLKITAEKPLYIGEWHPIIRGVKHQIIAIFMTCSPQTQKVTLNNEHDEFAWIQPADRHRYLMKEPDCFVIDELIKNNR